ncbi:MAG TPA: ATP-binding cassette domain-containing protein [Armatimonadota bacterium]|jgi:ATPase subunit of ABC transporter with duplicated ATPase domains
MQLCLSGVTFAYEGAPTPLFEGLSATLPEGWTGIVGPNGAGKTTLLKLAVGDLLPLRGAVSGPERVVYCPQRTDDPPEHLEGFLACLEGDACRLRGALGVEQDWAERWSTLSDGERKRAQIGTALWLQPEVLAIDEPTNHIDLDARELLARALRTFRGVGLLVSHDRDLLDGLCRQCLLVEPPTATLRPGGYTEAFQQRVLEEERARDERERARHALAALRKEYVARRQEADRADRRRSKRHLARGDSDGRAKIDAAIVSGADARAGRLVSQLAGRLGQAESALAGTSAPKARRLGIWLPGSRGKSGPLAHLPPGEIPLVGAAGTAEERLTLIEEQASRAPSRIVLDRRLRFPELALCGGNRVALTGPNGAGKSTLLRHLLSQLRLPEGRLTHLPQEVTAEECRRLLREVTELPSADLGHVMTVVSRLGSRPDRLLESAEPSPGEVRKLMLALGIARSPWLVVMDEPTNHLDLPALECLEDALAECPCALLLVSHDLRFLRRLTTTRWHLTRDPSGDSLVRVGAME